MSRIMVILSIFALLLVAACERQEQMPAEQRETQTAPAQPGQPTQEPGQSPTQPGQPTQEPGQSPTQPGQTPGGQQ